MSLDEKTSLEDLYNISLDSDIKANILKQNIIQESMGEWTDEFNRFIRYYNSNNKDKPIKKIYVYGAFQI